jgi:hypothetical protein
MIKLDGFVSVLVGFGMVIVLAIWGIWGLIDLFFISEDIRSDKPIKPEIELVIRDNKVDTVYVYKQP